MKTSETIEYNNTVNKNKLKKNWMGEKKELRKNKRMYGQFVREMLETADEKGTWNWLRKADLKVQTEAMLSVALEKPIITNYVKHTIHKPAQSPLCRICGKKSATISHIENVKSWHKRSTREGTIMLQE